MPRAKALGYTARAELTEQVAALLRSLPPEFYTSPERQSEYKELARLHKAANERLIPSTRNAVLRQIVKIGKSLSEKPVGTPAEIPEIVPAETVANIPAKAMDPSAPVKTVTLLPLSQAASATPALPATGPVPRKIETSVDDFVGYLPPLNAAPRARFSREAFAKITASVGRASSSMLDTFRKSWAVVPGTAEPVAAIESNAPTHIPAAITETLTAIASPPPVPQPLLARLKNRFEWLPDSNAFQNFKDRAMERYEEFHSHGEIVIDEYKSRAPTPVGTLARWRVPVAGFATSILAAVTVFGALGVQRWTGPAGVSANDNPAVQKKTTQPEIIAPNEIPGQARAINAVAPTVSRSVTTQFKKRGSAKITSAMRADLTASVNRDANGTYIITSYYAHLTSDKLAKKRLNATLRELRALAPNAEFKGRLKYTDNPEAHRGISIEYQGADTTIQAKNAPGKNSQLNQSNPGKKTFLTSTGRKKTLGQKGRKHPGKKKHKNIELDGPPLDPADDAGEEIQETKTGATGYNEIDERNKFSTGWRKQNYDGTLSIRPEYSEATAENVSLRQRLGSMFSRKETWLSLGTYKNKYNEIDQRNKFSTGFIKQKYDGLLSIRDEYSAAAKDKKTILGTLARIFTRESRLGYDDTLTFDLENRRRSLLEREWDENHRILNFG